MALLILTILSLVCFCRMKPESFINSAVIPALGLYCCLDTFSQSSFPAMVGIVTGWAIITLLTVKTASWLRLITMCVIATITLLMHIDSPNSLSYDEVIAFSAMAAMIIDRVCDYRPHYTVTEVENQRVMKPSKVKESSWDSVSLKPINFSRSQMAEFTDFSELELLGDKMREQYRKDGYIHSPKEKELTRQFVRHPLYDKYINFR